MKCVSDGFSGKEGKALCMHRDVGVKYKSSLIALFSLFTVKHSDVATSGQYDNGKIILIRISANHSLFLFNLLCKNMLHRGVNPKKST